MFDGICILVALLLCSYVQNQERKIAFIVLSFFVISDVAYNYFFEEFRANNNWFIYQMYNVIDVIVIYGLKRLNAHLFIIGLIALNVLINIVVSFYFISDLIPRSFYDYYKFAAGTVAILSLCYLWMIGYGSKYINSLGNSKNVVSVLFRRFSRLGNGGVF